MRLAVIGIVSAAVIVSIAPAFAQDKPDFSGTWTYNAERSSKTSRGVRVNGIDRSMTPIDVDKPPSPALGTDFTAKQDAKSLTLELTQTLQTGNFQTIDGVRRDNNTLAGTVVYSVLYALDGSESHNKFPSPIVGRPEGENVSTAAWNGSTLVVTITPVPSNPATKPPSTTRAFHLDSDGNLIVETTTTMGGAPWTYTTAYTRKK